MAVAGLRSGPARSHTTDDSSSEKARFAYWHRRPGEERRAVDTQGASTLGEEIGCDWGADLLSFCPSLSGSDAPKYNKINRANSLEAIRNRQVTSSTLVVGSKFSISYKPTELHGNSLGAFSVRLQRKPLWTLNAAP